VLRGFWRFPGAARTLRRLEDDLAAAEKDAAWLQHQLDQALDVAGINL
jgi:hypothetical protein